MLMSKTKLEWNRKIQSDHNMMKLQMKNFHEFIGIPLSLGFIIFGQTVVFAVFNFMVGSLGDYLVNYVI